MPKGVVLTSIKIKIPYIEIFRASPLIGQASFLLLGIVRNCSREGVVENVHTMIAPRSLIWTRPGKWSGRKWHILGRIS